MFKTNVQPQPQGSAMAGVDLATTQMNTFSSYVTMLADPNRKDDLKLKATQEISENFEVNFETKRKRAKITIILLFGRLF